MTIASGCGTAEDAATLQWMGNGQATSSFGMGFPVPVRGLHVSVDSIVLCRSGNGPDPKITRAAFVEDGSAVQVAAFASRTRTANETMFGSSLAGLADAGFPQGNVSVGTPCDGSTDKVTELGITAQSQTAPKAIAKTLRLTYESAGRTADADIPLTLVLCVGGTTNAPCGP